MAGYLVSNKKFKNIPNISLQEALRKLEPFTVLGLDTETTGLKFNINKLLLIQIGNKDIQIAFDITYFDNKIPDELKNFLQSNRLFIGHNIKFDLKFLLQYGVLIKKVFDTFLAEIITTNGLKKSGRSLKDLVKYHFDDDLDKDIIKIILTKGITEEVVFYAWKDVVYLEDLMNIQLKLIRRFDLSKAVSLDNNFVIILAYIEYCGFYLNWNDWKSKSHNDLQKLTEREKILNSWLGGNYPEYIDSQLSLWETDINYLINWNSPSQVIKLFDKIGINTSVYEHGVKKNSAEAPVLLKQIKEFPIIPIYLEYKEAQKVCSTYGLSWEASINQNTGRIHTSFMQLMDTGRLSCGNTKENQPNFQNVSSDSITRHCFQSQKGRKLVNADYSGKRKKLIINKWCKIFLKIFKIWPLSREIY